MADGKTMDSLGNRQRKRPTIGLLTTRMVDPNGQAIWSGATDEAQRQDVNLICFPGGSLGDPGFLAHDNVLFDLIAPENVDGLVSWASSVCQPFGPTEALAFHQRYHLPMVSLTLPMQGIPTVLGDTYQSAREALDHLIQIHGYRHLAFVRGPENHPYARERYRAYVDALAAHGLPFNPALVTPPGNWFWPTGREAARLLLDERKLRPRVDLDAVVSVSDFVAEGMLEGLGARGIRVPSDVALIGFDAVPESQATIPPLTTVAMSFAEHGAKAVELLVSLLKGQPVPEQVLLPSRLVVRQSCGCQSQVVAEATAESANATGESFETVLSVRRQDILAEMSQAAKASTWTERLLDSFAAEMRGARGTFLSTLDEILRQVIETNGDAGVWHGAISALRHHLRPYLDSERLPRAEDVWHQARVVIWEASQQTQVRRTLQAARQAQAMREISRSLITTFNVQELMDILAERLPRLGIPSCYLSLYEDPDEPTEWSRLMLAYDQQGRVELNAKGRRFPSRQLVASDLWPDRRYSFVVMPLYFQDQPLGLALFEVGLRDGSTYEMLRGEISSALQGALLVKRVQERSTELARQKYILDTFMDTVPDRIYFKDAQGRITRANQAHARRLGLSDPTQEIGKTDFDFFAPDEAKLKYEQEQTIISTGQPLPAVEEKRTLPDGQVDWSLTTKMPLRDETGTIIGTFGITRDITALKQAQQALERRAHRLQVAAEVSHAISTIFDLDELLQGVVKLIAQGYNLDGSFIFLLDEEHQTLVRAASADAQGNLIRAESQASFPMDAQPSMAALAARNRETVLIHDAIEPSAGPNNCLPLRSELAIPMLQGDQLLGVFDLQSEQAHHFGEDDVRMLTALANQIAIAIRNAELYRRVTRFNEQLEQTVQERTQELRRAYRALDRMDKTKSDFIEIAAHELRTPLTVIRGYAQILGEELETYQDPQLGSMLEHIIGGTRRLQEIINNMLDVATIDAKAMDLRKEPVVLYDIVRRVQVEFGTSLRERRLTMTLADVDNLPPIRADAELLYKVFHHLVINAIKYTPDGGSIRVSGQVIGKTEELPMAQVTVSDTGIGIDPAHQELIFEKFYQTGKLSFHSSGKTKFKGGGPGLGLAIARGIVLAHGGKIWAESPGHDEKSCPGSTFYVLLPVK